MAPLRNSVEDGGFWTPITNVSTVACGLAVVIFPILILALCACCKRQKESTLVGKKNDFDAAVAAEGGKAAGAGVAETAVNPKRDVAQGGGCKAAAGGKTAEDAVETSEGSFGLSPPPDLRFDACNTISRSSSPYVKLEPDKKSIAYRKLKQGGQRPNPTEEKPKLADKAKLMVDRTKQANERTKLELARKPPTPPSEHRSPMPAAESKSPLKSPIITKRLAVSASVDVSAPTKTPSSGESILPSHSCAPVAGAQRNVGAPDETAAGDAEKKKPRL